MYLIIYLSLVVATIATVEVPDHRFVADPSPFRHGVASADPLSDSVLIWTRAENETAIVWSVWDPTTGSFESNITFGSVTISEEHDYTVTVEVTGLSPNMRYNYAFQTLDGSVRSRIGSTKTAPNADNSSFTAMKIATFSCACHWCGFMNAYKEMAEDNSIDLVIALGDWLYPPPYQTNSDFTGCIRVPRGLCEEDLYYEPSYKKCEDDDLIDVPDIPPASYCDSTNDTVLEHMRYQHLILNTDYDVRLLRAAHPMINIPDNHDIEEVRSNNLTANPELKAWLEWVPTRYELEPSGNIFFPRVFRFGPLLDVVRMDTRATGRTEDPPSYLGQKQIEFFENVAFSEENKTDGWRILCSSQVFMPWGISESGYVPLVIGVMMGFLAPLLLGLTACSFARYKRWHSADEVSDELANAKLSKAEHYISDNEETALEKAMQISKSACSKLGYCCISRVCIGITAALCITFFALLIWSLNLTNDVVKSDEFHNEYLGLSNIQPWRTSSWDGLDNPRYRMDFLDQMKRLDAKNNIFITGDMHTSLASDVYDTAFGIGPKELIPDETTRFGVEFHSTSVSKANVDERVERAVQGWAEILSPPIHWAFQRILYGTNEHLKYWESLQHGYGLMFFSSDEVRFEWRWQDFFTAGSPSSLGTMTWGYASQTNMQNAKLQIEEMSKYDSESPIILDTARVYQSGQTEQLIGEILPTLDEAVRRRVQIHTKAHPMLSHFGYEGLHSQISASLEALRMKYVEVFYLHQPDISIPIEDALEACNRLHKEGMFVELGLSNFAAWDVVRIFYICKEKGYVMPTVYQGCYNLLSRSIESELLPAVRACSMRCYVYNPLAGGLLSGKYADLSEEPREGRFSPEFDFVAGNVQSDFKGKGYLFYRKRYLNNVMLEAIKMLKSEVNSKRSMIDFALTWLKLHSWLDESRGDGMIIGASKSSQCIENLEILKNAKKLSEAELDATEKAWAISRPVAEAYHRGYGPTPGNSENFLSKF